MTLCYCYLYHAMFYYYTQTEVSVWTLQLYLLIWLQNLTVHRAHYYNTTREDAGHLFGASLIDHEQVRCIVYDTKVCYRKCVHYSHNYELVKPEWSKTIPPL